MQPNLTGAPTTQDSASAADTKVDYTQEVRFAIVMYGGSSLAIYMNGVAQELLRMVRATAPGGAKGTPGKPQLAPP